MSKKRARGFPPNIVRNQKYHVATFLFVVLYHQFKQFFNLYFLLICASQFFPALRVTYLVTNLAPLIFVLTITISKEASDDYKRYRRDKEANSQLYGKLTPSGVVDLPSSDIRVGDIILVNKNQRVPADMILLKTTEKTGAIFIRTDQLDGETDWKLRIAVPSCQKLINSHDIFDLNAILYADLPHKDIHSFIGTFTRDLSEGGTDTESLNAENTLWMNTVIASGSAYGCVVYTGTESRAVMNTSHPKTKLGLIDSELNTLSIMLCCIVVMLSFALIALKGFHGPWYIYLIRFVVLFSTIIPLSLRVNLDMGKTVYSSQITNDEKIPSVIVRNSTIPEELGRIQYLLSDKTGTLTKNDMELKRLHMGTMSFGSDSKSEIKINLENALQQQKSSSTDPSRRRTSLAARGRRDMSSRIFDIVQALALCHNVTPSVEHGQVTYQASSPDEVAIVKWTESVGMTLIYRDRELVKIQTLSTILEYEILYIFPFTSETKRMGIIVRDRESGEITFYQKGADVVMSSIVQSNDWLDEECTNMAREGLRTLVIGRKRLSLEQYSRFDQEYREASLNVQDRNRVMQTAVQELLENDLELLGLTGVEDKLQDDVKLTLELLRNAGIKIWMLTGDKVETATCIAVSSKLVTRNQQITQVQKLTEKGHAESILSQLESRPDSCLVIDGASLQIMMSELAERFMKASTALSAVVCCRCTPTQKADVARMIKKSTRRRVCCIGDGGNDVSMIQAADVGVGIVGKEGKQASLAADFSIIQFSHLTRLLLWHGRNSYKRTAKLSQFVIHRGFTIAVMQAVFSAIFYFSPIPLYQGIIAVGYTTVYTMAPVFSLVLDKDVSEDVALLYPELYKELTKGRELTFKTFFRWLMVSVYQGGTIMLLAIVLFEREFIHIVSITFTALILNELLMVALEINTWHYLMGVAEIGSILIYVISMRLLTNDFDVTFTTSTTFAWKVGLITLISFLPLYLFKLVKHFVAPPSYTKLGG